MRIVSAVKFVTSIVIGVVFVFTVGTTISKAQVCQCSNWDCYNYFCNNPPYINACGHDCRSFDSTYPLGCGDQQCGAGYYVCNRDGNCCPYEFSTSTAIVLGGSASDGTGDGASGA